MQRPYRRTRRGGAHRAAGPGAPSPGRISGHERKPDPYRRHYRSQQRNRSGHGHPAGRRRLPGGADRPARRPAGRAGRAGHQERRAGQAQAHELDVTDRAAVDAVLGPLDRCDVLVANAGGAFGADPVATGSADDWRAMYEVNVLGTLNTVQVLLPRLIASGAGTIVVMGSTAGFVAYEGGGGYVAAKHGEHAIAATLRLELFDQPVRVIEIAPGMVRTDEFAVNRYRGDVERAAAVYAGVSKPLTAEDVADTIAWAVPRPSTVNVDLLVLRPRAQAAQHKVFREPGTP